MRRSLLRAFAADITALVAILSVIALAFVTWRAGGIAQRRLRGDAGAELAAATGSKDEPEIDGDSDSLTDVAEVASAELDAPPPKPASPRPFNVILITVDTLRSDIGFMGYPRPVSPNIDALAARSVVYEHAYAMASFTPKSLGPMLIGKYSSETYRDYLHYTDFFPANVFLAERIQAAGGRTVGAATHRYFGWKKGFDQGFDVWDTSAIPPSSIDNDPTITSEKLSDLAIDLLSSGEAADIPVRGKEPAVTAARTGPAKDHFFAWFHYLDPHLPYVPHEGAPSFASMSAPGVPRERAAYDAEVWFTDKQVGRLLEHVAQQPWAKETAIILTSDHGEAFGERGHWGHGREIWESLVHVPLLVFVPGVEPRRIQAKRSHIDLGADRDRAHGLAARQRSLRHEPPRGHARRPRSGRGARRLHRHARRPVQRDASRRHHRPVAGSQADRFRRSLRAVRPPARSERSEEPRGRGSDPVRRRQERR